nr:uncharacterized protein LOC111415854 [Onthophagus taurus]
MLRAVISMKKNVDISKYTQLVAFLKRQGKMYKPKKSKVLSKTNIEKFLREADDVSFLLAKVVLIIGIAGACRKQELADLVLGDVKDDGQVFCINIPYIKTNVSREFYIMPGGFEGINMVEIIRKYKHLRPQHADHEGFFVGYRNKYLW